MTDPARWRILLHALDRTGPPMLARAFLRWLAAARPEVQIEVLAFRGGDLLSDLEALGTVTVVLEAEEPWDVAVPDPERAAELQERLRPIEPATVNLLVSVAAAQALPLLPAEIGPVATWVVEVGEDLHWFDDPVGLVERTDAFLAGSETSATELAGRLPAGTPITVVPEFVEVPPAMDPADRRHQRWALGADDDDLLVVGAGIGTVRKGLDLFAEVAIGLEREAEIAVASCWIGGVRDPLYPLIEADLDARAWKHLRLVPPVADLDPCLAAADVFLHTARRDAFPLVCISAVAAGAPVAAFNESGGPAELLGSDLVGAPYPDTRSLAASVLALADLEARRRVAAAQLRHVDPHLAPVGAPVLEAAVVRGLVGVQP